MNNISLMTKSGHSELIQTLEDAPFGIVIIRPSPKISYDLNLKMLQILHIKDKNEIKELDSDHFFLNSEQINNVTEIINSGKELQEYAIKLRRADGEFVDCLSSTFTRRDEEGKIISLMACFVDVTVIRDREERLAAMKTLDTLSHATRSILHDFNNLLMGLQNNYDLLAFELHGAQENNEHVAQLMNDFQAGIDITKEMISKLRMFQNKAPRGAKLIDLHIPILDAIKYFKEKFNYTLIYHLSPESFLLSVDYSDIFNLVINILRNSMEALEGVDEDRAFLEIVTYKAIKIEFEHDDYYVVNPDAFKKLSHRVLVMKFTDNGRGMDRDTLYRAFEPYFTTKTRHNHKYSGLGLVSVYNIVERYQGSIMVQSSKNDGTKIFVLLPAKLNVLDNDLL